MRSAIRSTIAQQVAVWGLLLTMVHPGSAFAAGDVLRGGVFATGMDASSTAWERGDGDGVYVSGRATTDWRLRSLRSANDELVSYSPLWQTFHFAMRDDAPRRRVSFEASFRGGTDLVRGGFRAEVMTAFVEVEPSARWGSFRVGRQLIATAGSSGFVRLDGLKARMTLHRVGVEAFAGVPLRSRLLVLRPPGADEASPVPSGWGHDFTWGAAVFLAGHKATQLRVGLQDRLHNGALARRHLTVDFSQGIATRGLVRADLAVDLLQRQVHEAFVAVELRPLPPLKVGVEYRHWQASFDADSIWSVFETDPYDQIEGRIEGTPSKTLRMWFAGGAQLYPLAVTQDAVPRKEIGQTSGSLRGGVTVRPLPLLEIDVHERTVLGTGGTKVMLGASVGLTPWEGRLRITARGDLQRYAFALQPGLHGEYGSAGIEVTMTPAAFVQARIAADRIFSPFLKNQLQLSASLHFLLGVRGRSGRAAALPTEAAWEPALLAAAGTVDPRAPAPLPGLHGGIGLSREGR